MFFIIHVILLGILTVVAGIGSVAFAVAFYADTYSTASGQIRTHPKWLGGAVLCGVLFFGGLTWWIASGNESWTTELDTAHEIKEVTFPDGTKQQMFTCDGVHHNITTYFGKIVEPADWVVKRVRWNPYYLGVSWSSASRCQRDQFFLVKKDDSVTHELIEPQLEGRK